MNNYYGNRLVKFVSPQCDKVFSLELSGEEMELKDLIATILNIPISDLKGIKDTQNNYYTFSSAIKNQQLTSSYSKYYTIVLGNSFNNDNKQLSQWPVNNYINIENQSIELRKKTITPKATVYDQRNKHEEILNKLIKGNYIDEKTIEKINQALIEENNQELMMLFNNYYGYDLKILADKLFTIITHDTEKSGNKDQLITYTDILDSLDDHFEDKGDISILKKLLSFDNEHIIKLFQNYEEDCDILKLVDNLNQMVILYKDKFEDAQSTSINNKIKAKNEQDNKELNEVKSRQIQIKNKIITDNYNELYQMLSFELKAILVYAKQFHVNYADLFQIEQSFEENKENRNNAVKLVKQFYDDFMQKNVYVHLKKEEMETYDKIINDNSNNKDIQSAFKVFQSNFDIGELKENIMNYVREYINTERKAKEKEDNNKIINESKIKNKSEVNKDNDFVIGNKKKEKSTITLKFKNSTQLSQSLINGKNNNNSISNTTPNKKDNESYNKNQSDKMPPLNNKKVQEFTKVINTLSINEQNKSKILELLSQKDPKVVKLYENFVKNRMSLTKNVVLNVIQIINNDNDCNNSKKEEKPIEPISFSNQNRSNKSLAVVDEVPTNASSFDSVIVYLEKEKVISPGESAFIKKRYQNNDEMILSIWEVFKASNAELPDFIDSLQTFISKHHSKSINLPDPVGAKTPISITNTKKEMLNLFRSNEKSEMNKIKNKQKQIISLLLKEKLIESSNYDFFNMKIDAEDPIVSSVFEVFSITRDHRDFVETLNLIKDIMYNKESVNNDPLSHQKNILNELLDKSTFNSNEKEILIEGLRQNEQIILSAIELYEEESDLDEALDTLHIYVTKKKNKMKQCV